METNSCKSSKYTYTVPMSKCIRYATPRAQNVPSDRHSKSNNRYYHHKHINHTPFGKRIQPQQPSPARGHGNPRRRSKPQQKSQNLFGVRPHSAKDKDQNLQKHLTREYTNQKVDFSTNSVHGSYRQFLPSGIPQFNSGLCH